MLWLALVTSYRLPRLETSLRDVPCLQDQYQAVWAILLNLSLQAKRDEEYLEEYRKQAHAALLKDPYSTSFSEDPELVHRTPRIRSVIKYNHQNPVDGSSFSSSSQVRHYQPAEFPPPTGSPCNQPDSLRSTSVSVCTSSSWYHLPCRYCTTRLSILQRSMAAAATPLAVAQVNCKLTELAQLNLQLLNDYKIPTLTRAIILALKLYCKHLTGHNCQHAIHSHFHC